MEKIAGWLKQNEIEVCITRSRRCSDNREIKSFQQIDFGIAQMHHLIAPILLTLAAAQTNGGS
jgi:hypothetical protein